MSFELQQAFDKGKALYDQAKKTEDKVEALKLLETAKECFQESFRLAEEVHDKQKKYFAQAWLGLCIYQQAEYTEAGETVLELLEIAKCYFQESFSLAEVVTDKYIMQFGLGRCVYMQAVHTENEQVAQGLLEKASWHFQESLKLAEGIIHKRAQCITQNWLGECFYRQAEYVEQGCTKNEKLE